jgi:hypothetical protein
MVVAAACCVWVRAEARGIVGSAGVDAKRDGGSGVNGGGYRRTRAMLVRRP